MSSQALKSTRSSRADVADVYDDFLKSFMKLCIEEDVCKLPRIAVVDKAGAEIADPEVISRKLSQINASLHKASVQSITSESASKQSMRKSTQGISTDKEEVRIAGSKAASRADKSGSSKAAPEAQSAAPDIDDGEAGDSVSAPETSVRKKAQFLIVYGRPDTLTGVAMKSTRVEAALLRTIGRCLSLFPTISQLTLDNCRLTQEDVFLVAVILRDAGSVKELILDGNSLGDMCFSCLLPINTNLLHLSLCGCQIGDVGVAYLSEGLEHMGDMLLPLQRLNLSSNQITCKGAELLANALRTNRALLSISLSGNLIENTGAIALAEAFQKFQLRYDECLERRGRYFAQNMCQRSSESMVEDAHPFLADVEWHDSKLYCKGNFTLLHLNLSYNSIGLPGVLAFHQAVLYQESVLQPPDKGLLTVCFQGNPVPEDRPELEEMSRIFDARINLHRKSSKTSSLESSRSTSKTSSLGASKGSLKLKDDAASVKL